MKEPIAGARGPYLAPLSDAGFMRLFGNEAPKDILIGFLNALLKGDEVICDLEHKPITQSGAHPREGEILMDLLCTDDSRNQFSVHLQRSCRGIAYESLARHSVRLLGDQRGSDEPGAGGTSFPRRVYIVGLMNFIVPTREPYDCIMERKTKIAMYSGPGKPPHDVKIGVKSIEVPGFVKSENELTTDLDKWIFLLKNMGVVKEIPAALKSPVFEKVFQAAIG